MAAFLALLVLGGSAIALMPGGEEPTEGAACAPARGTMGICAPARIGLQVPRPSRGLGAFPTYPDLSNNDPTYNMGAIARAGHPAVYLKVNQGTGFTDGTFLPMAHAAITAHLAVGGYDFAERYDSAEAYLFVARLHAAGMWRSSPGWLPPTLDVEFGSVNRGGLQTMVNILFREFGRVNVYTGGWYWTPHLGCFWPANVTAWLSGYPFAPAFCGLPGSLYSQHQYTDKGWNGVFASDMSVFLGSAAAFRSFAHIAQPPPPPKPNLALKRAIARRGQLRVLLRRHRCRPPLHASPRAYGAVCRHWLGEGKAVNRTIAALQHSS